MAGAVATIVTCSGTECASAPESPVELPFTVSVKVCACADAPAVTVRIDDAGVPGTGDTGSVPNAALTPVGWPDAERLTLSPKSPSAVVAIAVEATPPSGIVTV